MPRAGGFSSGSADRRLGDDRVDALHIDHCASGNATSLSRFNEMLSNLREGGTVVVYSLSRFSHGMKHLMEISERLDAKGIDLASLTESIDTSTAMGRFVHTMLATLAATDCDLLAESRATR